MDFAISTVHGMKTKKCERLANKYLNLVMKIKKEMNLKLTVMLIITLPEGLEKSLEELKSEEKLQLSKLEVSAGILRKF